MSAEYKTKDKRPNTLSGWLFPSGVYVNNSEITPHVYWDCANKWMVDDASQVSHCWGGRLQINQKER